MLSNLFKPVILLIFLLSYFPAAAQEDLGKIVNPKLNGSGYVSNADHIIKENTAQKINSMVKPLDQQGKAQIAVVLVNSIGEQVPKDFATALFRKWGIGNKKTNNGLLILIVKDQKRMEFEVGYGLEGVITDLTSSRIQTGLMVPYFKKGDYDTGILKGLELVVSTIDTGVDQSLNKENMYPEVGLILFQDILFFIVYIILFCYYTLSKRGQYITHSASWLWLPFLLFAPLIIVSVIALATPFFVKWTLFLFISYCCWTLFLSIAITKMLKTEPIGDTRLQKYQYLKLVTGGMTVYTLLFPFPVLLIQYIAAIRRLYRLRYEPYTSADCVGEMVLLKENRAQELSTVEQTEERLGAVSYDLWKAKESEYILKLAYVNQDTKIRRCKKCRGLTAKKTKRVVEKRASTESGGMISIYYTCQVCGGRDFINKSIARKEKNDFFTGIGGGVSSGSDSGRSSSGGSSGGSSGSDSSGSSSDWGGGSSGGGGSGSSW